MSDPTLDAFLTKSGNKFVTFAALNRVLEPVLADLVKALREEKRRNAELEARVKQLETRPPAPEYCGTFEQGKTYRAGSLLTRQGGLWLAVQETVLPPGSNPATWKLVVKSGGGER